LDTSTVLNGVWDFQKNFQETSNLQVNLEINLRKGNKSEKGSAELTEDQRQEEDVEHLTKSMSPVEDELATCSDEEQSDSVSTFNRQVSLDFFHQKVKL
jgi:hypothetical protein